MVPLNHCAEARHSEFNLTELSRRKVIWTEVSRLPDSSSGDTFIANDMVIALCLNGRLDSQYDMSPVNFRPHDISVMLPNHIVSGGASSPDYRALLIVVARELYDELIHRTSFHNFHKFRYRPCFHLDPDQFANVLAIIKVLQITVDCGHPKRLDMIVNVLDVLFYTLSEYRDETECCEVAADGVLFQRFYDLLSANYARHHHVAWYADKLCLTPKYFSTAIRRTTGKTAGEWIDTVLSLKAKSLINSSHKITVTEISDRLGFSSKAAFCRFFRRINGLTPTEYRSS